MRNPAVEYNIAVFSELSFAVHWQGRLSRGAITTGNRTNLVVEYYLHTIGTAKAVRYAV